MSRHNRKNVTTALYIHDERREGIYVCSRFITPLSISAVTTKLILMLLSPVHVPKKPSEPISSIDKC